MFYFAEAEVILACVASVYSKTRSTWVMSFSKSDHCTKANWIIIAKPDAFVMARPTSPESSPEKKNQLVIWNFN